MKDLKPSHAQTLAVSKVLGPFFSEKFLREGKISRKDLKRSVADFVGSSALEILVRKAYHARSRCEIPTDPDFRYYGARGVTFDFDNVTQFAIHAYLAGYHPGPGMTIDRVDSFKGYEPGNLRLADRKTQSRNKTCVRTVTYAGRSIPHCDLHEALRKHVRVGKKKVLDLVKQGFSGEEISERLCVCYPLAVRP